VKSFLDKKTDDKCLDWILNFRLGNFPGCRLCDGHYYRNWNRKCYSCSKCGNQISPLAGTIFEKSSTPMQKWFFAIGAFKSNNGFITVKALSEQICVTYKTAWRIRETLFRADSEIDPLFRAIAKLDPVDFLGMDEEKFIYMSTDCMGPRDAKKYMASNP
jgi:hypothetical protein